MILIEPLPAGSQVVLGVVTPETLIGGLVLLTEVLAVVVQSFAPVTVTVYGPEEILGRFWVVSLFDQRKV